MTATPPAPDTELAPEEAEPAPGEGEPGSGKADSATGEAELAPGEADSVTGEADSVPGEPEPEPEPATGEGGPEPRTGRPTARLWRGVALATALTALLLGGGAFFYGAHQLRTTPSARNQALTDTVATTRVGGDVGEGLARIFSYTPTSSDAAERNAATVLAGRAARQYGELFAQVRESLVEQRITLSTQAVRTGVIELDGDGARVLVFLDQVSHRDKGAATSAAAQLTVTARFQDDRWLITDIKPR
ncbi:hypothetical protein ACFQ8C_27265 [Streptomyces sp. NPDC056503]|uniref:hypothetical protein n=1 Tax=Streptomyces sp. NPDC056503 TaxID=3345842 RepID=UPI0036BC9EEF